jgi:hypothetical protein
MKALNAHVRAAGVHDAAAALHAARGDPVRARVERDRAAAERAAFDAAVKRHPELAAPPRPATWSARAAR